MKPRRLSIHHILPALSLVFTLFVFAPVDLYLTSAEDLWFSLSDIAPWLGVMALCAFAGIVLLAWLLPPKLSAALRAMAYAGSFLLYLQGNLLVINYGVLNGEAVNWSAYTLRYILDALLWVVVVVLFVFLMFRFRKKFRRILEIAACVLLVTQVASLSVFLVRYYTKPADNRTRFLSSEGEFAVSPDGNTVVFVLDTFDSHLFENLLQQDPDKISGDFAGFTWYRDTVGGATRTKYAIPFILTGLANTEDQSYTEYLENSFAASPLIAELATGKYDTGLYTVTHYVDMSRSDAIGNDVEGRPEPASASRLSLHFMKLVAFRYAPSVLSRYFWMYTGDFEFWKGSVGGKSAYKLNDQAFRQKLAAEGLKASADKPAFRFYHLNGPHPPFTMNAQGETVEKSDEAAQALGSLAIVSDYLSRMKDLGVYDRSTVIVMADHGVGHFSNAEQTPLFMVRPAGADHPFEVSDLPLSYASLPEIMVSALRGELASLEPWRASSPRYFYHLSEKDAVVNLTEYTVDGPALETAAVPTGTVYHEDTLHRSNDAEMAFDLPEVPGALTLRMVHGTYQGPQTVEVWINDQLIETYSSIGSRDQLIRIPAGVVTGTELRLRLHLPDAVSPNSLGTNASDKRLLALSMKSLTISPAEE